MSPHHEGRIKTYAELTDELRVFLLIAAQLGEKFGSAGTRNGAQMLDGFLTRHADTVIRNADGMRDGVQIYTDGKLGVVLEEFRIAQGREPQLVARVGSVGNQLAKKDLFVAVERMNHQLEQLFHLGLKATRLLGVGRHLLPHVSGTERR